MNTTFDLTQIALAIIALISAVLTGFVIPWLKSKINLNIDNLNYNQQELLKLAISTAVRAAEQIYNSEEGQKKKSYVLGLLKSQGYNVDDAAIDAAVEAAVLALKHDLDIE